MRWGKWDDLECVYFVKMSNSRSSNSNKQARKKEESEEQYTHIHAHLNSLLLRFHFNVLLCSQLIFIFDLIFVLFQCTKYIPISNQHFSSTLAFHCIFFFSRSIIVLSIYLFSCQIIAYRFRTYWAVQLQIIALYECCCFSRISIPKYPNVSKIHRNRWFDAQSLYFFYNRFRYCSCTRTQIRFSACKYSESKQSNQLQWYETHNLN